MSRGPVVCGTTTDKSRNTSPYLHVYVVTAILPTKTQVEVSLCFIRHLWSSKGNQLYLLSCITLFKTIVSISLYKRYKKINGKVKKEHNSTVTNQLSSHLQSKEPIKLLVGSWLVRWVRGFQRDSLLGQQQWTFTGILWHLDIAL